MFMITLSGISIDHYNLAQNSHQESRMEHDLGGFTAGHSRLSNEGSIAMSQPGKEDGTSGFPAQS